MSQDEERAVSALIGAGRTLNPWREPVHAVECELNISMAEARALVEVLQHRGLVRVKREKTSGFPACIGGFAAALIRLRRENERSIGQTRTVRLGIFPQRERRKPPGVESGGWEGSGRR